MDTLVIVAPNWLGDAVMALPAIADVRRQMPNASMTVAARPSVGALFRIVPGVDEVIDPERIDNRFSTAILLPNSFRSAWLAAKADVHERWGYRTQLRGALLTRAIARPPRGHQVDYYRFLVNALGFPNGPREPALAVPAALRERGAALLRDAGCTGGAPIVALAPGAAYGGAKRWPAASFAELARALVADGVQVVMIGTSADMPTAADVARAFDAEETGGPERAAPQQPGVSPQQPGVSPQQPGVSPQQPGVPPQQPGVPPQQPGVVISPQQPGGVSSPQQPGGVSSSQQPGGVSSSQQPGGVSSSQQPGVVARPFQGRGLFSLVGQTDLPALAGVLANCRALVTNDSGAMHLAAAVGTRVTAVFGPTNERATSPIGGAHAVLTHDVWCRPCMLRECPIDHRCMRGITPAAVALATRNQL